MKTALVLTLIGPDKPGLVELVSGTLSEHRANWLESSMSRLGGQFAGILIADVETARCDGLLKALAGLESKGLSVIAKTDATADAGRSGQSLTLELIGHDKPGIVREISRALAQRAISLDKLKTEVVSGSMSAEQLFKAEARLYAPADTDLDELQSCLEDIASDLMVDITLN